MTVAINYQGINWYPERAPNIKPYINKYKWKVLNYPSKADGWNKIKKRIQQLLLTFCVVENEICPAYISKNDLNCKRYLTLFRMGFFGFAHGWGRADPPSLKSVTHILHWWNVSHIYLTQSTSKKYINHVTHPLGSADLSIFSPEIRKYHNMKKYRYRLYFDT